MASNHPVFEKKHLQNIKLVAFDFDGVFTNNKVLVNEFGAESVECSRSDGLGISNLRKTKLELLVISTEKNPVVSKRCAKLGLACHHGIANKFRELARICNNKKILLSEVAFVGNDINDLECMTNVGFSFAVSDSYLEVIEVADYVTKASGGNGAVREICDIFIEIYSES